jgi:hypothetical protein
MAGEDEFAARAAAIARAEIEENLIQQSRSYEDAMRSGDEVSAAWALKGYAAAKRDYDTLSPSQQQSNGQLSNAQRNFLSRRQAGGDQLDAKRMADYARGHDRAVAAGFQPDTAQYFAAVAGHVDHLGDGRQPPLDEREAARISGISDQEYAANAQKIAALKRAELYD